MPGTAQSGPHAAVAQSVERRPPTAEATSSSLACSSKATTPEGAAPRPILPMKARRGNTELSIEVMQRIANPFTAFAVRRFDSCLFRHRTCLGGDCATRSVPLSCNGCLGAAQVL